MDTEQLKQYLEEKSEKSRLEILVLHALKDDKFLEEYNNIQFGLHIQSFLQVLQNPRPYDNPINNQFAHYQRVLIEISNAYSTFLYDNKGKYTNLKSSVEEVENRINKANKELKNIEELSEFISGEKILNIYAEEFKVRATKYEEEAKKWQKKLYWSFGVLAIVVVSFLFVNIIDISFFEKYFSEEIQYYGYLAIVFIKVFLVIGLIQVTRFFYKNYNANKHLESQSLHKYDVLRALQGVYNTLDNKEMKDELIRTGAITAFQNTESGYITTKEGAGSSDAGLYSAIGDILKK